MTRTEKKQIDNNKIAPMVVTNFTASGTSDDVTSVLVTAAAVDDVTVTPSDGTESSLGFIVTSSDNLVKLVDTTNKNLVADENLDEVFGRLTESSGVYTLSYFSNESGIENAISLSENIDFFPNFNYALEDYPFDANLRLGSSILDIASQKQSLLSVTSNVAITQHHDIIEMDATSSKVNR